MCTDYGYTSYNKGTSRGWGRTEGDSLWVGGVEKASWKMWHLRSALKDEYDFDRVGGVGCGLWEIVP